jgi:hypothetical protein
LLRWLPGIVLGAFLARVAGEAVGLPTAWAAAGLTAALAALFGWLLSHVSLARTWPALFLAAYLPVPAIDSGYAAWVAAAAGLAWLFNAFAEPLFLSKRPDSDVAFASRLTAAIVFVVALAIYGATLSPDVLPADSGELQVVAANLGVAHPPGFPLYTMLAHLMTRLPLGPSPAYRVNLFSALTAALALAVVAAAVVRLTRRSLAGPVAALALGTATTFWAQATTANVRSLTALFTALVFYCLLRWRDDVRGGRGDRWLIAAALAMGFGLTHHPSLVFLLLVVLLFVPLADRALLRQPRRWLWPALAGLAGLLPLLYLPLRAGANVRGASTDLATLPGFLEHVLATGFRGDLFYYTDPASLAERLRIMGEVLTFSFVPLLPAGMVTGLALLIWRDRPLAWLLGGSAAIFTLVAATYRAPQTVEYMMPAYVALAIILGYAVGEVGQAPARWPDAWRAATAALFAALMLVAGLWQGLRHAPEPDTSARETAGGLLDDAPEDSVILAHWHWVTPLWYLQEVEGRRPDAESRFVFPDGESYDATWAQRTGEAFATGRPVATTYVPAGPRPGLPVPEPLGEALLYPQEPRAGLPDGFETAAIRLGEAVNVLGYRIESADGAALAPGSEMVLTVAWQPRGELPAGTSLFLHLVGGDGLIYGQTDVPALAAEGVTLTQFRVTPRLETPAGVAQVMVGAAGASGASREPLTRIDVLPMPEAPFTQNAVRRGDLIGYDWDHTAPGRRRLYLHWAVESGGYRTQVADDDAIAGLSLPPYRGPWGVPVAVWRFPRGQEGGHYVPFGGGLTWTGDAIRGGVYGVGDIVPVDVRLDSNRAIRKDVIVSVRLMGLLEDGRSWAWWDLEDSVPAMGAIPTLKWIDGSSVRSPHRPAVQEAATPGQALAGALTLYDAFTNRALPILDERLTAANPWVPLGTAAVAGADQ